MRVEKILTKNDTGETGSHQSGIAIPKKEEFLNFFPKLPLHIKNPRAAINFFDEFDYAWQFDFVYYNNINWSGSRNEFRLVKIRPYIKRFELRYLDKIILEKYQEKYYISHIKNNEKADVIRIEIPWTYFSD